MENKNKIILGWLAFCFAVGHFAMIFIYAFPEQYMPNSLRTISSAYVYPVFEQNWSLFAPCPTINAQLEVQYYFESDTSEWINPITDVKNSHSKLRFTHHGDLVLCESNILFWTGCDLADMGISLYEPFPVDSSDSFKNTGSYWRLHYYLRGNAGNFFDEKSVGAVAHCTFQNVQTGEFGTLELPEFNWKE